MTTAMMTRTTSKFPQDDRVVTTQIVPPENWLSVVWTKHVFNVSVFFLD